MKVRSDRVAGWEDGSERISVKTLDRLADLYKRPTITFYLPTPPDEPPNVPLDDVPIVTTDAFAWAMTAVGVLEEVVNSFLLH